MIVTILTSSQFLSNCTAISAPRFSATSSSLLAFGSLLTSSQFLNKIVQQSQQSQVLSNISSLWRLASSHIFSVSQQLYSNLSNLGFLSNVQLSFGVWLSSHIFSVPQQLYSNLSNLGLSTTSSSLRRLALFSHLLSSTQQLYSNLSNLGLSTTSSSLGVWLSSHIFSVSQQNCTAISAISGFSTRPALFWRLALFSHLDSSLKPQEKLRCVGLSVGFRLHIEPEKSIYSDSDVGFRFRIRFRFQMGPRSPKPPMCRIPDFRWDQNLPCVGFRFQMGPRSPKPPMCRIPDFRWTKKPETSHVSDSRFQVEPKPPMCRIPDFRWDQEARNLPCVGFQISDGTKKPETSDVSDSDSDGTKKPETSHVSD